jgi:hypothetical protein
MCRAIQPSSASSPIFPIVHMTRPVCTSKSDISGKSNTWEETSGTRLVWCEHGRVYLIEKGSSSRREKSMPAMMVWNHGKLVETLMSSSIHEDKPARDQLASPSHIGGA